MKWFYKVLSSILGRNLKSTPKEVIIDQLHEVRALPMGKADFEEWSYRIISGACIPCLEDKQDIFIESQMFALANMLLHLGPTESHKPDAYFVHSLRKVAVNQVADAVRVELRDKAKARTAADENIKGEATGTTEALV